LKINFTFYDQKAAGKKLKIMRIITGDNTGLTKVVNVEKSKVISTFGE